MVQKGKVIRKLSVMLAVILVLTSVTVYVFAQGAPATNGSVRHNKEVIGYITQWDAWKDAKAGIPGPGAYTHLNVDMDKYTILNWSFFGVANDGSLHSGDYRNKNIYQPGTVQQPAPLFMGDPYSSWDLHILFGTVETVYYLNEQILQEARAQGFDVSLNSNTWSHPDWGVKNEQFPMPMHKPGGEAAGSAPGLLELAHQKGVKVMASAGGWSMCRHYPEMAASATKRQTFINDCIRLLNLGFDGIDLDWEYPGPYEGMNFVGTEADFQNFTTLVKEMRAAFDQKFPGREILITSCFSADYRKLEGFKPYMQEIDKVMDYYNMMTYDMNGGWSNIAGHNSPVHDYSGSEVNFFNWDRTLQAVEDVGMPLNKVNFGMPFYGRGVICKSTAALNAETLKRDETVQPDGPIKTCADYTNWPKDVYDGTPNYSFVKQKMSDGWTRHWDDEAKVPYLVKGNYFLSYDDVESTAYKSQYIVNNNLAGTIIWQVYGDLEFGGSATSYGTKLKKWSNVDSELVDTINDVFGNAPVTPTPTPVIPKDYTVSGSIVPDMTLSSSAEPIVKAGFKVEAVGTGKSTTTDANGNFTLDVSDAGSYTIKISKPSFLEQTFDVDVNGKVTAKEPITMWAGDMNDDRAINMTDIMAIVPSFNSAKGDSKYVESNDLNKDDAINMTDIIIVVKHFNKTGANYPAVSFDTVIATPTPIITTPTPKTPTPVITTPTPIINVPEWSADNVTYNVGNKVTYQGATYECTFAHSSNAAWTPSAAMTLWKKV